MTSRSPRKLAEVHARRPLPTPRDLLRWARTEECYVVTEALAARYRGIQQDTGFFVRDEGDPADHAWLVDASGTIYDPTYGQFDPSVPVLITRPGEALHARYRSWRAHHNPRCLMRELGVAWPCEAPGCTWQGERTGTRRANPPKRLVELKKYLDTDVDPWDFAYLLRDYFRDTADAHDEDPHGIPDGFNEDDPQEWLVTEAGKARTPDFKRWILNVAISDVMEDAHSPSYLHFSDARYVPSDVWLVHFSDEAPAIAQEGFLYGHADTTTLALTTWFTNRRAGPGWNFGFVADSHDARRAAYEGKYGRGAVMLRGGGVSAYHQGDEEVQVLFWGPSVTAVVLLERYSSTDWGVDDTRSHEAASHGRFQDVTRWVTENFDGRGVHILRDVRYRRPRSAKTRKVHR